MKTGLLFFERPGPTKETLYYELPLPEGLKKFSKGSPIADEHFAEARRIWQCWDAYRRGKGPRPEPTANSWIEAAETPAARGYDVSAKNPNRPESEKLPHPAELIATLLERNRELQAILENLHTMLNDGNETDLSQ